jgi:hypothetical protein
MIEHVFTLKEVLTLHSDSDGKLNQASAKEAFRIFLKCRQQEFINEAQELDKQKKREAYALCRLQQDVIDNLLEEIK